MQKYLILDTESVFDSYLREAYLSIDPACERARIGCRSLVAIALMPIEIDALGRVSTGALKSWTLQECATEHRLVAEAFAFMHQHSDHVLVTHGGLAVDCQILQLAAMAADLALPRHLAEAKGPRWKDVRHIDVGLAFKASGKTWHHLSELLLRLGIPVALLLGKPDPSIRPHDIDWRQAREHCEADVLFTALVLVAWLRLQGAAFLRLPGAQLTLLESYLRQRPDAIRAPMLRELADGFQRSLSHGREA